MKEKKYIATVKMRFNKGKLEVEPGDVVWLGQADIDAGISIDNLLKNGGIIPYRSEVQRKKIIDWWNTEGKKHRDYIKSLRRGSNG